MRTIADIEDINLSDCHFSKDEYNRKFVTLSFHNRRFKHSFFKTCKKGDYITVKRKRYYYPFNDNRFVI